MKLVFVLLLAGAAVLLFFIAALAGGGEISVHDGGWLLPAGLLALALSWFVSLLPVP